MKPHRRLAAFAGVASVALAVQFGTACGPTVADVRAPTCSDARPEGLLLVAQSVPRASQIPCIVSYPADWKVGAVEVRRGRTSFRLHAASLGLRQLQVTLRDACDLASATPAPSDEPGIERFDQLPSRDGARLVRTYTFAGGCVTYDFRFSQLKPALVDEGTMAVGFVSRHDIDVRYYRGPK